MSAPHLVDLPAFGANASTIADRLGELTPEHHPSVDDALTARFCDRPQFDVRGLGDHDLIAQLLVRAAIDNGYRTLRVTVLSSLARDYVPLVDHLEDRLPSVISLETSIVGLASQDPAIELGPRATPAEFRAHVLDL